MKRLIIFTILFFIVVAISPLLIDEKGYVLISLGNKVVESSILSAIIILTLAIFAFLMILRILRRGWKVSLSGWNNVVFANRRSAFNNLHKGIAAYILADYQQAELLLAKSAESSQLPHLAYLLAASAASKQQLISNTNHYMTLLEDTPQTINTGIALVLVKIKLLLEQQAFDKARKLIDEHHKHIGHDAHLLSLTIDLCLIELRFQAAIDYIVLAKKQKSITNKRIEQWQQQAFYGVFAHKILNGDQNALFGYWQGMPRKLKQSETILFAYCQVLAEHNIQEPLNVLLLPALKKDPSQAFLVELQALPIKHADELIAQVQKQLHNNSDSAKWLSCLGHLAAGSGQWSMAEKAFNSRFKLEQQEPLEQQKYRQSDLQAFANALTHQDKHKEANQVLRQCLTLFP
jgi:HemY protein